MYKHYSYLHFKCFCILCKFWHSSMSFQSLRCLCLTGLYGWFAICLAPNPWWYFQCVSRNSFHDKIVSRRTWKSGFVCAAIQNSMNFLSPILSITLIYYNFHVMRKDFMHITSNLFLVLFSYRLVVLLAFLAVASMLCRSCIPWFLKLMIKLSTQVTVFFCFPSNWGASILYLVFDFDL